MEQKLRKFVVSQPGVQASCNEPKFSHSVSKSRSKHWVVCVNLDWTGEESFPDEKEAIYIEG